MSFNLQKEKLRRELQKRKGIRKVLIQLPDGVKKYGEEIAKEIEKLGIEAIISGENCWGGCDVAIEEARKNKTDLIVHYGHAPFIKTKFPVVYIEIIDKIKPERLLKKSLEVLKNLKTLGLCAPIQQKENLKKAWGFYKKQGKRVMLSEKKGHAQFSGQILGCSYEGLKSIEEHVDGFLVIGNLFHSLGASLSVNRPVFLLDVYNNKIWDMNKLRYRIIRQRAFAIEKFKSSKQIGIIVGTKAGQKFGNAGYLKKKLKEKGKDAVIISMGEIAPEKLLSFYNMHCFIELACPRIAIDEFHKFAKFRKFLLTYREALVGLGEISWEEFLRKGVL